MVDGGLFEIEQETSSSAKPGIQVYSYFKFADKEKTNACITNRNRRTLK